MKKIIVAVIVVIMAFVLIGCTAHCVEDEIIKRACNELDLPSRGAKLYLVYSEEVPWLDYDVYTYILTTEDGRSYIVDVQMNENGIHYVDVIEELKEVR